MDEHPTELDLELLRTGEAEAGVGAHVERCASCRDRLAAQRSLALRIARPLAPLAVPRELDDALARLARERGPQVRRREPERRRGPALRRFLPAAAAACLVLGFGFLALRAMPLWSDASAPGRPATPAAAISAARSGANDVNSDGEVDVLDAYLVALAGERGQAPARFDRNGDGRVDRRDAERIAVIAVALGGTGD